MSDRARPKATKSKLVPFTIDRLVKAVNFNLKFKRRGPAHDDTASPKVETVPEAKTAKVAHDTVVDPHQRIINSMTNWQRTQWARAGYKLKDTKSFAELQRPNHKQKTA